MIWQIIPLEWLAGIVAAILGALGLYFKGRSDAKANNAAKDAKQTIKQHEVRNEVDADSRRDARQRLRDWRE